MYFGLVHSITKRNVYDATLTFALENEKGWRCIGKLFGIDLRG